MAMLAEKKTKVKWCVNPNGNEWAKDENKFGQRLLMKMGWKPGTGLGAKNQGITEIVKMKVKSDTKGLGRKVTDDDNSTKVLVDYDNILAELGGVSKNTIGGNGEISDTQSLEEKSKASRTRIHYHKFTRGKDVTKYSPKDLNCILSLSVKKDKNKDNVKVNSGTNMYDYFKDKVKNPYKNEEYELENENMSTELQYCSNLDDIEQESCLADENIQKKKKKRKNRDIEVNEVSTDIPKKKKKKCLSEEDNTNEANVEENYEDSNQHEELLSKDIKLCNKTKKKKKKSKN